MNQRPSFVYVTYIATTPEKLWEAITQGDFTKQYFFGRSVRSDWREGSAVTYLHPDGELDVFGKVVRCEPHRLLVCTWEVPGDDTPRERPTRVTFKLQPLDSAVKLTLMHEELLDSDYSDETDTFRGLNNGWPAILSNLKSLLETGRTLPFHVE
ncbi:SRPBCC family protein [Paenibacillus filicis]|uniref:SRPBCC family protein n=1 Tax=Paenibacillus gyeongsangnamensis TaxID=3388067 RepID=A0ABT4QCG4_9BACL|nr:SRPBCC family protein [Paenibacillus filicis]MCZ8514562.1 SRPBCC family protein [Paenibacillus filicis]